MPPEGISSEQAQAIVQYRERKLSPKEIARQMGLRPAAISEFLRSYNAEIQPDGLRPTIGHRQPAELAPLLGCWINQGAVAPLLQGKGEGTGMAQIIVARMEKQRYTIASILIDYWCLGVKDALFKKSDRAKYEHILTKTAGVFGEDLQEVSLEQVQSIVFGAIDYAADLGFSPHPDFAAAQVCLGPKADKLQRIKFGKSGKPFYFSGPYDNPERIIQTLRQTVGEGNFDYMMAIG
jgi:hypothetical protein